MPAGRRRARGRRAVGSALLGMIGTMRKIAAVFFYALSAVAAGAFILSLLAAAGALDLSPPVAWTLYGVEMLWLVLAGWRGRRYFLPE